MKKLFKRKCPKCSKIVYCSLKQNRNKAELKKSPCRDCSLKIRSLTSRGRNNPFFGKKHSAKTKRVLSLKNKDYTKTKEFSNAVKKGMIGHPGNRLPLYTCWLRNHGKKIADEKMQAFKKKQSLNNKGVRNAMYGKPSPRGSGNGWSGWYKNFFFRSLRELSFILSMELQKKEYYKYRIFII